MHIQLAETNNCGTVHNDLDDEESDDEEPLALEDRPCVSTDEEDTTHHQCVPETITQNSTNKEPTAKEGSKEENTFPQCIQPQTKPRD